jgi:hypothetical protein
MAQKMVLLLVDFVDQEKYKAKPWILEDDIGQQRFQGQLEGGQQAIYYLLMMSGQEFLAFPAGAWYAPHVTVSLRDSLSCVHLGSLLQSGDTISNNCFGPL